MIVTIDGIDRTGKNTLHKYLEQLANHKYVITDRGILTQLCYTEKFNREYVYNLDWFKNNIIVHLIAEKEDIDIRCKLTNEPYFDVDSDAELFKEMAEYLASEGFIVLTYNTSEMTPYMIAKDLCKKLEAIEKSEYFAKLMKGQ